MPPEYHLKSFWSRRFERENHFEWLGDGKDTIIPLLRAYLESKFKVGGKAIDVPRTLHIGAGTSSLSDHVLAVYHEVFGQDLEDDIIVNTDFAEQVVQQGRQKAGHRGVVKWETVDMLSWKDVANKLTGKSPDNMGATGEALFDVVVHKSTSDAISCAEELELDFQKHEDWSRRTICPTIAPPVNLPRSSSNDHLVLEPLELLALHLAALVRPGGIWLALSYSNNRFPFLALTSQSRPIRVSASWTITKVTPVDAPSGQTKSGVHAPAVQHFLYVLERTHTSCEEEKGGY